jgi:hypothetical protein
MKLKKPRLSQLFINNMLWLILFINEWRLSEHWITFWSLKKLEAKKPKNHIKENQEKVGVGYGTFIYTCSVGVGGNFQTFSSTMAPMFVEGKNVCSK